MFFYNFIFFLETHSLQINSTSRQAESGQRPEPLLLEQREPIRTSPSTKPASTTAHYFAYFKINQITPSTKQNELH